MPATVLAVAEVADGALTKLSTEVATLARRLADGAGGTAVGLVVDAAPDAAAQELATYLPRVVAVSAPGLADQVPAPQVAAEVARLIAEGATHVVLGATPDGRDISGTLVGLTGLGLLVNADDAVWEGDGPVSRSNVLAGKAVTRSAFTGQGGILTLRPGSVTAEAAGNSGTTEARDAAAPAVPVVAVLDRVEEAGAQVSLEDASVVVVGGRGVASAEGFGLVEELAELLGGVAGATRASVDSGWVPYARQIGQTGRMVKPKLYLGLGVSGAMQHRVGMQASQAIVVINRDPDAPMAEVADLFVVGDLFEVAPALASEIRARRGG